MLRFAPSPTEDLHIQNLRVALFNYIISIQKNEELIVRIEDIDEARNIEGKDKEIVGLLDLFGINYRDVVYQSANLKYHRSMAIQLLHEKIAFNCFCTPQSLQAKQDAAKKANEAYRYDDTCLTLTPEQTIDNESPFTVRLRKPNVDVEFSDRIRGKQTFSPKEIDSFLILDEQKRPTYNFACAVDDMLSDISFVIRSDEHLEDTPKQIAARAALNYTKEIEYAHLPALLNDQDKKISEHDDGYNVKWLLEEGFLPQSIVNYLIALGNQAPKELFSLEEAIQWFDIDKISKTPVRFSLDQLCDMNRQHLQALDDVELSRYVGFADQEIGQLAKLYLEEVSTTKGLRQKIDAVFSSKDIPDDLSQTTTIIKETLHSAPFFEEYDDFITYLVKETGIEEDTLSRPLQLLIRGSQNGPDLALVYPLIKNYLSEVIK